MVGWQNRARPELVGVLIVNVRKKVWKIVRADKGMNEEKTE